MGKKRVGISNKLVVIMLVLTLLVFGFSVEGATNSTNDSKTNQSVNLFTNISGSLYRSIDYKLDPRINVNYSNFIGPSSYVDKNITWTLQIRINNKANESLPVYLSVAEIISIINDTSLTSVYNSSIATIFYEKKIISNVSIWSEISSQLIALNLQSNETKTYLLEITTPSPSLTWIENSYENNESLFWTGLFSVNTHTSKSLEKLIVPVQIPQVLQSEKPVIQLGEFDFKSNVTADFDLAKLELSLNNIVSKVAINLTFNISKNSTKYQSIYLHEDNHNYGFKNESLNEKLDVLTFFDKTIPNIIINDTDEFILNLSDYISKDISTQYTIFYPLLDNISILLNDSLLHFVPQSGLNNTQSFQFFADDGKKIYETNLLNITVISRSDNLTQFVEVEKPKLEHGVVIVGQPVVWKRYISLQELESQQGTNQSLLIYLPANATNISVIKSDSRGEKYPIVDGVNLKKKGVSQKQILPSNNFVDRTSKNSPFNIPSVKIVATNNDTQSDIDTSVNISYVHDQLIRTKYPKTTTNAQLYSEYLLDGLASELTASDVQSLPKEQIDVGNTTIVEFNAKRMLNNSTLNSNEENISSLSEIEVEYQLPGPQISEKNNGNSKKRVTISSQDHYVNVLASALLPSQVNDKSQIQLLWRQNETDPNSSSSISLDFTLLDLDNNSQYDTIEWVVPHLSTQVFDIIVITRAQELDNNRTFLRDVYGYVSQRDNNATTIASNNFIRIKFEKPLDSTRDITIYAKPKNAGEIGRIIVYEYNSSVPLDSFENISTISYINNSEQYAKYQIILSALGNTTQDTFDLLVDGPSVDIDFIIDPLEVVSAKGMLVYAEGTGSSAPQYRFWDGSQFGSAASTLAGTNTVEWIRLRSSPVRYEYIMGHSGSANDVWYQVYFYNTSGGYCWGNGTTCGNIIRFTTTSSIQNYQKIGLGYEKKSGRAMTVWSTNTATPSYSIWNGSFWTDVASVNQSVLTGTIEQIRIAQHPSAASNELALLLTDSANKANILIWNGSSWYCQYNFTSSLFTSTYQTADIEYERKSGDLFVIVSKNGVTSFDYITKANNSCSFTLTNSGANTERSDIVAAASQEGTDFIGMTWIRQSQTDLESNTWNGTALKTRSSDETNTVVLAAPMLHIAPGFLGTSQIGLFLYGDASPSTALQYMWYNTSSNVWTCGATGCSASGITAFSSTVKLIQQYSIPNENASLIFVKDANSNLYVRKATASSSGPTFADVNSGSALSTNVPSLNFPMTVSFAWQQNNDLINPNISYIANTPSNNTNTSLNWLFINLSVNESNQANLTFSLYNISSNNGATAGSAAAYNGQRYQLVSAPVIYNTQYSIINYNNFTNLADGLYWFNVTIWDLNDHVNYTEGRRIRIDNNSPILTYVNQTPANNYYKSLNNTIVNLTLAEHQPVNVTFNWNGTVTTIYNTSLVLQYDFENDVALNESLTNIIDSAFSEENATSVGSTSWTTGKYGGAISFDGSSSYVTTKTQQLNPQTYTIELWFKTNTVNGGKLIGFGDARTGASAQYDRHIYMLNNGTLAYGTYNAAVQIIYSKNNLNDNNWHHVMATQTAAGVMTLYVDGVFQSTRSASTAQVYNGYWRIGYDNLNGWTNRPSSDYFSGAIDSVRIYPTALSSAEVLQRSMTAVYKVAPSSWIIETNQTNLSQGTYNYRACVNDTVNNNVCSSSQNITIDWTAPTISFVTYTDANGVNVSRRWIGINVSSNDTNMLWINTTIYNSVGAVVNSSNYTTSAIQANNFSNLTVYADGVYYFNATAVDRAGNLNYTATYNITIDTLNPNISYVSYTQSNTGNFSQNWLAINVSANDSFLRFINISVYNNAQSLIWTQNYTAPYGTTSNNLSLNLTGLADGTYWFNATATDIAGNRNFTTTYNVTLDTRNPNISYVSYTEVNGANLTRNWFAINVSANDTNLRWINITVYNSALSLIWTQNYTATGGVSSNNLSLNMSGVPDGIYWFNATVTDWAANTNATSTYNVSVDTVNPNISYVAYTQTNNANLSQNWLAINVSANDTSLRYINITVYNSSLALIWAQNYTAPFGTTTNNLSLNLTGLADGTYWFNATATDRVGNTNKTLTYNVTLDTRNPNISYVSYTDADGTFASRLWTAINVSTNDTNLRWINISIYNSSQALLWRENLTVIVGKNPENFSLNYTVSKEGTYYFNASVSDYAGNVNYTSTRNITLDVYNPNISYVSYTIANLSSLAQSWIAINVSANDSTLRSINITVYNASLNLIWTQNVSYNLGITQGNLSLNLTGLSEGFYYFNATVKDYLNKTNSTGLYTILLDNLPPVANYVNFTASNTAWVNRSYIPVNMTIVETNLLNSTVYLYNSALSLINTSINTTSLNPFRNFSGLADGIYYFNASVSEWSTNYITLPLYQSGIDTLPPRISYVSPTPPTTPYYSSSNSFTVNTSVTDENNASGFIDWNRSLILYMPFEDTGTGTTAVDYSSWGNNGTFSNAVRTPVAKRGGGAVFVGDGGSSIVVPNNSSLDALTGGTVEAFINLRAGTDHAYPRIVCKESTTSQGGAYCLELQLGSPNYLRMGINGNQQNSVGTLNYDQWYHVAMTYDGTNWCLYIDGAQDSCVANAGLPISISQDLVIGNSPVGPRTFNGTIDEVKVWSRALNSAEISASYNASLNNLQRTFTNLNNGNYTYVAQVIDVSANSNYTTRQDVIVDTISPNISYISTTEINNSNLSRNYILVNVTSNDSNFRNMNISIYNSSSNLIWRQNGTSSTNLTLNFTVPYDGIFYFNATATDLAGWTNSTLTRRVFIDTTIPQITFVPLTDANNTNLSRKYIEVNVSLIDASFSNITTYLYNNSGSLINSSFGITPSSLFSNFTIYTSDGYYLFNATGYDGVGLKNSTSTYNVTIDTTPPQIDYNLDVTTNNDTTILRSDISVGVNVTDLTFYNVTIRLYNSSANLINQSWATTANFEYNFTDLPDGTYYYNATAYDSFGRSNSTKTFQITLDTRIDEAFIPLHGMLVYGEGTDQTPRFRIWNYTDFADEQNTTSIGATTQWVDVEAAPNRYEYIAGISGTLDDVNVMMYSYINGTTCWNNGTTCNQTLEVTTTASSQNRRKFDIEYEQLSGRAMVVYTDGSTQPKYRIWNGTTWTAQGTVPQTTLGANTETTRMASRKGTNEIALLMTGQANDMSAIIWNGTAWDCQPSSALATSLTPQQFKNADIGYEQVSGDLFLINSINGQTQIDYHTKAADTCTFVSSTTTTLSEESESIALGVQEGSDYIMIAQHDVNGNDMQAIVWNGSQMLSASGNEQSIYNLDTSPNILISPSWAGTSDTGLLVYSDAPPSLTLDYMKYNKTTDTWYGGTTGLHTSLVNNLSGATENVYSFAAPGYNYTLILLGTENDDLFVRTFNGDRNTFGIPNNESVMEDNLASPEFPSFNFAWRTYVDTIFPLIDYVPITQANDVFTNNNYVFVNVSVVETNLQNITFGLYSSINVLLSNITYYENNFKYNFSGLGDATYYYNVTVIDLDNHTNSTATRNITIDTVAPTINYVSPTNTNNTNTSSNFIPINVTTIDINFANVTIRLYNSTLGLIGNWTNTSSIHFVNVTGLSDGIYYYNASATDLANNIGYSETRKITIDTTYPNISYVTPTDTAGANVSRRYIIVNVSANDTNLAWINISLYNSSAGLINSSNSSSTPNYVNFTVYSDGIYYYNATASDYANLKNYTITRNITIDTIYPNISYVAYTDNDLSNLTRNWFAINVSANDSFLRWINISVYNGSLTLIATQNYTVPYGTTTNNLSLNVSGLTDGVYWFNATATDWVGSVNATSTRKVTIDTTNPLIAYVSPTPLDNAFVGATGTIINTTLTETNLYNFSFVWNQSTTSIFDYTLLLHLGFNNMSGLGENNNVSIRDSSSYNRTVVMNDSFITTLGKYGSSAYFRNTPGSYVNVSMQQTAVTNYSIEAWVRTNATQGMILNNRGASGAGQSLTLAIGPSCGTPPALCSGATNGKVGFGYDTNTIWVGTYANNTINDGQWHHVVGIFSSTSGQNVGPSNFSIYIDGILQAGTTASIGSPGPSPLTGLGNTIVAYHESWTAGYNGYIDELRVWNKSLTASQVAALYRSSFTKYNQSGYVFTANMTNQSEGTYYYQNCAQDNAGNANCTSMQNVTFDLTSPQIGYVAITEVNNSYLTRNFIQINASVNETNFMNVTINLYNSSLTLINSSTNTTSLNHSANFTVYSDGIYYFNATAYDAVNNTNFTQTYKITIDTTNPSIVFISPTESAPFTFTQNNYIRTATNVTDTNFANTSVYLYRLDGSLLNITNSTNNPFYLNYSNVAEGIYIFNATAFDLARNYNATDTRIIGVDLNNPIVSYVNPTPASALYLNRNWTLVNITTADTFNTSTYLDFNRDLLLYYSFSNWSGNTVVDDSSYRRNGTLNNSVVVSNLYPTRGDYANFTGGSNDAINLSSSFLTGLSEVTFSLYAKTSSTGHDGGLFRSQTVGTDKFGIRYDALGDNGGANNVIRIALTDSGGVPVTWSGESIANQQIANSWQHIALTWKSGEQPKLYINGSLVAFSYTSAATFSGLLGPLSSTLLIGDGAIDTNWPGQIDEFMIFRRALNATEIAALANSNATVTTSYFANITNRADGNYSYNGCAQDTSGRWGCLANRNIIIDTTAPNISYVASTEVISANLSRTWFIVNVTANDTNLANITIRLYNSTGGLINQTNFTTSGGAITQTSTVNYTGLANGVYYYNATATDYANWTTNLTTRNVTIDTVAPTVTFVAPTLADAAYVSQYFIAVNVTVIDLYPQNVTVWLYNSTNQLINSSSGYGSSISPFFANFTNISDGVYYYNVTAYDMSGNVGNTSTRSITIDTLIPKINYTSPTYANNSYNNASYILVNVTAIDATLTNITINLYNASGSLINSSLTFTSPNYVNFTNLVDGVYYFNATAFDDAFNQNSTPTYNVTLDTSNPTINYVALTDANESNLSRTNVYINVSAFDWTLQNISISIYNNSDVLINTTNTTSSSTLFANLSIYTGDGYYLFNATAYDYFNRTNSTNTYNITIDTTVPQIDYDENSTSNNSILYQSEALIGITAIDLTLKNITIRLYNSSFALINTTVGYVETYEYNFSNLSDGVYYVNATAYDYVGLSNSTLTYQFTINTKFDIPNIPMEGLTAYANGQYPEVRFWNYTDFGASSLANNVGGVIEWLASSHSSTRYEYIVATGDTGDDINIQMYSYINGTTCWNNGSTCGQVKEWDATASTVNRQKVDVAHEQVSGKGLLVWADATGNPRYVVWNGTTWIGNVTVPQTRLTGNINSVKLAPNPFNDEIALAMTDSNNDLSVMIWNGTTSTWGCEPSTVLNPTLTTDLYQRADLAWAGNGSLYVVSTNDTVQQVVLHVKAPNSCTYKAYNQTLGYTIAAPNKDIEQVTIATQGDTGYAIISTHEISGNDMQNVIWNGTSFSSLSPIEASLNNEASPNMLTSAVWPLNSKYPIVLYSDLTPSTNMDYMLFDQGTNLWTGGVNGLDVTVLSNFSTQENNILSYPVPGYNYSLLLIKDGNSNLYSRAYNGLTTKFGQTNSGSSLTSNTTPAAFPTFTFTWRNYTDTVNPQIDFISPTLANSSIVSQSNIYMLVSLNESNLRNITYYVYNATSGALVRNVTYNLSVVFANITGLADGIYEYNVTAYDLDNQTNSTQTRNITLDTTAPLVIFVAPTNSTGTNTSTNFIQINVTVTDVNFANVTIRLYNSTNGLIANYTNTTSANFFVNITGLADGIYYYNASAKDLANNTGYSANYNITIDTIRPNISYISATESDGANLSRRWFIVNVTANDTNFRYMNISIYNSTNSLVWVQNGTSATNLTINFTAPYDGDFYFNATATDWVGWTNSTLTRRIFIDTQAPQIAYVSPTESNNTYVNRNWLFVNVSVNETNLTNVTIWLYNSSQQLINTSVNFTNGITNHQINFTNLADGMYFFNATAIDVASNTNRTSTRNVTIDTISPTAQFISNTEVDFANISRRWIIVNVSANDTNLANITIRLYNFSGGLINSSTSFTNVSTANFTVYNDGTYYFNATATDYANWTVELSTRTLIVDTIAPTISFIAPTNVSGAYNKENYLIVNITTTDLYLANSTIYLYNSSYVLINSSFSTTSPHEIIFTNLADGIYFINASAIDYALNVNYTVTRNITIDTIIPNISFVDITDIDGTNVSRKWLDINVTANDTNFAYMNISVYNSSLNLIWIQNGTSASNLTLNFTAPYDGDFYFNATVTDLAGWTNSTPTRHVLIDTLAPQINFVSPTDISGLYTNRTWIFVNVSLIESHLQNLTIWLYNSSGSVVNISENFTNGITYHQVNFTNLADGTYYFNATAIDFSRNVNATTTRFVTIDTISPDIYFVNPTLPNNSYISQNYYPLNISVSNSSTIGTFTYNWNGTDYSYYNDSLLLSMSFENKAEFGDTSNTTVDQSKYQHIATCDGGCNYTAGKYGGGIGINGTDRILTIPDSPVLDGSNHMSWEFWFNANVNDANPLGILSKRVGSNIQDSYSFFLYTAGKMSIDIDNSNDRFQTNTVFATNRWYHVITTYDGTLAAAQRVKVYVDGVLDTVGSESSSSIPNYASDLYIGSLNAAYGKDFDGVIDEVRIFNTTLTSQDVSQFYMSNFKKYNLTQWNLYVNQSQNATTGLDDGNYSYSANVTDAAGNFNSSEIRNIVIDTTVPQIGYVPVTEINNTYLNRQYVQINVGVNETNFANVTINLYNSSMSLINSSTDMSSKNHFANFTVNADGIYYFNATTYDLALNVNYTQTRSITIDTIAPAISFVSVTDANGSNLTRTWIDINVSASDINFAYSNISIYNSSYNLIWTANSTTYNNTLNFTTPYDGIFYFNATATDFAGWTNSTQTWQVNVSGRSVQLQLTNITYDNLTAIEGEINVVHVNVSNLGVNNATNVTVELNISLWNGTKNTLINYNFTNVSVAANSSVLLNYTWTVEIGTFEFNAFVDPQNKFLETNESDNVYARNYTTSAWAIQFGQFDYKLYLANSVANELFNWSTSGVQFTSYYSDVDSSFAISNLVAFNQTDDFNQSDSALNISGYSDSIRSLFDKDNNGIADQTITAILGGVVVSNIPIINTTNSTNFITGILWDSADSPSNYNGSQDLVFITFTNYSKVGYYGTYDYEIRIPSRLKKLVPSTDLVVRIDEMN